MTIVLSVIGWTGLARVVRGKLLELREADFVMAAQMSGATESRVIGLHLLPSFSSYLIVSLTLAVPYMMLGETALSFLGLGIRAPAVSWGALLKEGPEHQDRRAVALAADTGAVRDPLRARLQLRRRRPPRRRRPVQVIPACRAPQS